MKRDFTSHLAAATAAMRREHRHVRADLFHERNHPLLGEQTDLPLEEVDVAVKRVPSRSQQDVEWICHVDTSSTCCALRTFGPVLRRWNTENRVVGVRIFRRF